MTTHLDFAFLAPYLLDFLMDVGMPNWERIQRDVPSPFQVETELEKLVQDGLLSKEEVDTYIRPSRAFPLEKSELITSFQSQYAMAHQNTGYPAPFKSIRFEVNSIKQGSIYDTALQWTLVQIAQLNLPGLLINGDLLPHWRPLTIAEQVGLSANAKTISAEEAETMNRLLEESKQEWSTANPDITDECPIPDDWIPTPLGQLNTFYTIPYQQCLWCGNAKDENGEPFISKRKYCHVQDECNTSSVNYTDHSPNCCAGNWYKFKLEVQKKIQTRLKSPKKKDVQEEIGLMIKQECWKLYQKGLQEPKTIGSLGRFEIALHKG